MIAYHIHPDGLNEPIFSFMCCFCGNTMEDDEIKTISVDDQTWWCHWDCFVNALHEDAREFRNEKN